MWLNPEANVIQTFSVSQIYLPLYMGLVNSLVLKCPSSKGLAARGSQTYTHIHSTH